MATVGALAIRRAGVQERLDAAAQALSKRFGLAESAALGPSQANRDAEIGRLEQLERVASLLEAVLAADGSRKAAPAEQTAAVIDPATGEQTVTVIETAGSRRPRRDAR